jgi:hypothetical protein
MLGSVIWAGGITGGLFPTVFWWVSPQPPPLGSSSAAAWYVVLVQKNYSYLFRCCVLPCRLAAVWPMYLVGVCSHISIYIVSHLLSYHCCASPSWRLLLSLRNSFAYRLLLSHILSHHIISALHCLGAYCCLRRCSLTVSLLFYNIAVHVVYITRGLG